jgi:phenylacetate-coenzyme A ligase PaaK-like adenylate-forming protein
MFRFLAVPVAYISIRHYSHWKRHGVHPDDEHHLNEGRRLPMTRANSDDMRK